MRTLLDENGKREIVFLTQTDKEFLIYMSSDVWITPELKRFKNDLLERAGEKSLNKKPNS
ncbi:MAG: hypothetical protein KAS82_07090 [Bacteroidales bacterium]|nr:hypothetical protein [Bacteroidales bacterium]